MMRSAASRTVRLQLAVAACLCPWAGSSAAAAQATPFGQHLSGRPLAELGPKGVRAVVLFFVATDCPLSDRTFPEMVRLRSEFGDRGVQFWFVYANATEAVDAVRSHQHAFDAGGPHDEAILDPTDALVQLAGAKVTPEAAVLVPGATGEWKTVYRGRIDDRIMRIGLERPAPTQMLVEQALKAILTGRPVAQDAGTPVGCGIVMRKVRQR